MDTPIPASKLIDRRIGYVLLALVTIAAVSMLIFLTSIVVNPPQKRIVYLDQTGNLVAEDPIVVRGVIVGKISKIESSGNGVAATMLLTQPVDIRQDYTIATFDKGIMGDRVISIVPGSAASPQIPVSDTLVGTFYIGISEVLGMASQLIDLVDIIGKTTTKMLYGTNGSASFVAKFNAIIQKTDTLSADITKGVEGFHQEIGASLEGIDGAISDISAVTKKVAKRAPEVVDKLDGTVKDIDSLIGTLEAAVDTIDVLVAKVNNRDSSLWTADIASVAARLSNVRTVLKDLLTGAQQLKLLISRWK